MANALLNTPLPRLVEKATGFKLSPAQHALLAIATGARVQDLRGDVRAAAELALGYAAGPDRPVRVLFLNKGARGGGTLLASYIATHRALVADLSGMAPGERCRVGFTSLSMRQSRAGLDYAKGFVRALGLGRLIASERLDSFTIKRDGHAIELGVLRGNTAGDYYHGFWWAALCVHEVALSVAPSSNGVPMDLDAVEKAVKPRLLPARGQCPGAIIVEEGTSREPSGPAWTRFTDNHGKPDAPITVFRATTLELRPDDPGLRAHVAAELEADPITARREFECQWLSDGGSGYVFGPDLVEPCIVPDRPVNLPPDSTMPAVAGVDLSFIHDQTGLAILRQRPAGDWELCALARWKPTKNAPLQPTAVLTEILGICQLHGAGKIYSDIHSISHLIELSKQRRGLQVLSAPAGAEGKVKVYSAAQDMLRARAVTMGRDHLLGRGLSKIVATKGADGAIRIRAPRTKGGHADDVSAFVLACWAAHQHGQRGRDPAFKGGRISLAGRLVGLIDAEGRPLQDSAGIQFGIDAAGTAVARPARRISRWGNPGGTFGSGGF